MNWNNIQLVFLREVRDQFRDRRTLFMIAVLPLLLYPLLGMSYFQVAQFMRQHSARVLVVGAPELADLPPLFEGNKFAAAWLGDQPEQRSFELTFHSLADETQSRQAADVETANANFVAVAGAAKAAVEQGEYEAALVFPPEFAGQLEAFRTQLLERREKRGTDATSPDASDKSDKSPPSEVAPTVPQPIVYCNLANEKSSWAVSRLASVLRAWTDGIGAQNLKDSELPADAARPFSFLREDVAKPQQMKAMLWSKILPFVLLIWALTGAFYPAIDLCAGEKERGTLETLLTSPALRGEIVTGKLLTVMTFSMATSVLNLISMGITGALVLPHLPRPEGAATLGMPPLLSAVWLLVALVPVAALFSALCLALASFARSSKEGQYYLMPLVMITMPLVIFPMSPGVELNLGNALIPLTGLVLLLRALLEGNYAGALPFVLPVVGTTLVCCYLAVRWAVDQFNKESVLFRESERLDMGLWLRHLVRDRMPTPTVGQAVLCGVLILVIKFFMGFALAPPEEFAGFAKQVIVVQVAVVLTPALLMTLMLTSSARQTLLLRTPTWWTVPAAVLLAVAIHPLAKLLQVAIERLYPVSQAVEEALKKSFFEADNVWQLIFLVALLPAICEELAFRGFILSGFRHLGRKWQAIALSSLLFGLTHSIFQQQLMAGLLGVVIGFIAVQTGSIWPGMAFHFTNNALAIGMATLYKENRTEFERFAQPLPGDEFIYSWWLFGAALLLAVWLVLRFANL